LTLSLSLSLTHKMQASNNLCKDFEERNACETHSTNHNKTPNRSSHTREIFFSQKHIRHREASKKKILNEENCFCEAPSQYNFHRSCDKS